MSVSLHAAEGVRLMTQGMTGPATQAFERALADNPKDLTALLGLARVHLALSQDAQARGALGRVLEVNPTHTEALGHLARLDAEAGDERGVTVLRGLVSQLDAGFFEYLNLGRVLLARNVFEDAAYAFELARKQQPNDYHVLTYLGLSLRGLGRFDDALACFLKASSLTQREHLPLLYASRLLAQKGQVQKALEFMRQALSRAHDKAEIYPELIKLIILNGDPKGAAQTAAEFRQLSPQSAEGAYLQGLATLLSGDPQGADAPLRDAISLEPTTVEARVALANVRRLLKDPAGELTLLEAARKQDPSAAAPACDLAVIYLSKPGGAGRAQAIQVLTAPLAASPEDPNLNLNMALALADSDKPRAREHARKALKSTQSSIREQAERLVASLG